MYSDPKLKKRILLCRRISLPSSQNFRFSTLGYRSLIRNGTPTVVINITAFLYKLNVPYPSQHTILKWSWQFFLQLYINNRVIGTTRGKQLTDVHNFCKEFGAKFSLFAKIATKRIIRTVRLKEKYVNVVRGTYPLPSPLSPGGWSIMCTFSKPRWSFRRNMLVPRNETCCFPKKK